MIKLTTSQRITLYNTYEGHCAFCGRTIDFKDMVACNLTGYHLPSCKTCSNSSYNHDLDSFRYKIKEAITHFYNSRIGVLLCSYSGLNTELSNDVVFYFEKEINKPYLHMLSIKDRMLMLTRNITQEELLDTHKLPQWCDTTTCNKWLNLKIFTVADCENCKTKKEI